MAVKTKVWLIVFVLGMFTARAASDPAPLPRVEEVLKRILEQAGKEGELDRAFKANYSYSCSRKTEYRNARGTITRSKAKTKVNDPLNAPVPADGSESATEAKKKPYEEADVPMGEDMLGRFSFTLVKREIVNGRATLVIDFEPATKKVSERNLKEKFLNKAAGRLWVDEADSVLVKASVQLTKPVNVVGGLVGTVRKFTFQFMRQRTPEGIWFTRDYQWHLEGREVVVDRVIDFSEEIKDVLRVTPIEPPRVDPPR